MELGNGLLLAMKSDTFLKTQEINGGDGGGGKTIKMWWRWENNRNVVVVVYSFTIFEAVLKKS